MEGTIQNNLDDKLIESLEKGELSLGKIANLLEMDKAKLRMKLSEMNISVINESVGEVIEEAKTLLGT